MLDIKDIRYVYLVDSKTGKRVTYSLNEIEEFKSQCKQFGNVDGMEACCHECNENSHGLFEACWYEKFKDLKPNINR